MNENKNIFGYFGDFCKFLISFRCSTKIAVNLENNKVNIDCEREIKLTFAIDISGYDFKQNGAYFEQSGID